MTDKPKVVWKRPETAIERSLASVRPAAESFTPPPTLAFDDAPPIFTPPEDVLKSRLRELQFVVSALREENAGLKQEANELRQMLGMGKPAPVAPAPKSKAALTGAQRAKLCRDRKKQQTVEH